jgi:Asp-tRNA(Asn)/Glu-tRNA(Gln) amidotransferase A subunit family amidase
VDERVAAGQDPGPLAGVPFAVKNLFDAGVTTLAGSRINAERPPAQRDAAAVAALRRAGAVCVGCLNMDEYAYGFTTENTHYGATRNPRDLSRVPGGSAAAVAAGLVPPTLGSDTNGSIRVPAVLCGVFGLEPTYGRRSAAGLALRAGAALPRLVSRPGCRGLPPRRRAAGPDHPVAGAAHRGAADDGARGRRRVHAQPSGRLHPAAVVHRPARHLCPGDRAGRAALGVQLVAPPFREAALLRVAVHLEAGGVVSAPAAFAA